MFVIPYFALALVFFLIEIQKILGHFYFYKSKSRMYQKQLTFNLQHFTLVFKHYLFAPKIN